MGGPWDTFGVIHEERLYMNTSIVGKRPVRTKSRFIVGINKGASELNANNWKAIVHDRKR